MEMTAEEICRDYRLAKNKNRQLRILADLNVCSVRQIYEILAGQGLISGVSKKMTKKNDAKEAEGGKQNGVAMDRGSN